MSSRHERFKWYDGTGITLTPTKDGDSSNASEGSVKYDRKTTSNLGMEQTEVSKDGGDFYGVVLDLDGLVVNELEDNASKKPLGGGRWVTISGAHVFVSDKDGRIVEGPDHMKGKTPAEIEGTHQPGDVVTFKIGQHKGQKGTVVESPPGGPVIVKTPSGRNTAFEHDEIEATGEHEKKATLKAQQPEREGEPHEEERQLPDVPAKELQKIHKELGYIPVAGQDTPIRGGTPTSYTKTQLNKASLKAGKEMFDHPDRNEHLFHSGVNEIRYRHVDDLRRTGTKLDDFEYVFKPSTGKGLMTPVDWRNMDVKKTADKDGKIYSYQEPGIVYVTETRKGRRSARNEEQNPYEVVLDLGDLVVNQEG